ncbi:MAG TPA: IclR family transcriptional regulator [Hypericibacter adhaerens]|jgi:IclR family acetate operon transcriptional repressor|uniref:IclR family transcriptional regulator n=1 Tax=Hypericibacter adhaerens TaxID=2602016 RepID=A0A5J6N2N6_9PROT|nr:IclR family transcriptional regulator [Hypericibacter adhaerens]QEX22850.1 IclR family transcriptional regulator [Hypericibacter adhaerens]HWA42063.1 IclR family transcriptional regulator [Hypericibacter adhaerens]
MTDERYRVQSLGRALDLLELVARQGREGARLSDLARELTLSKAATYAILQTLLAHGFVADVGEGQSRRYRLGLTLARLGELSVANFSLADLALPILREMTEETGMTSRVAVLDGDYAVVVGRVDGPGTVRFGDALGRREWPHCSAVGKAMLAAMPRRDAEAILKQTGLPRRTPHTITSLAAMLRELSLVTERGYAVDDEEDVEGVICVGACVHDRAGAVAGALSITGLKPRQGNDRIDELGKIVRRHAERLSASLGAAPNRTLRAAG